MLTKGSEQSGGSSSEPFKCTTACGLMLTFSSKAHVGRLVALGKNSTHRASRHDRRSNLVKILHGVLAVTGLVRHDRPVRDAPGIPWLSSIRACEVAAREPYQRAWVDAGASG